MGWGLGVQSSTQLPVQASLTSTPLPCFPVVVGQLEQAPSLPLCHLLITPLVSSPSSAQAGAAAETPGSPAGLQAPQPACAPGGPAARARGRGVGRVGTT